MIALQFWLWFLFHQTFSIIGKQHLPVSLTFTLYIYYGRLLMSREHKCLFALINGETQRLNIFIEYLFTVKPNSLCQKMESSI